MEQFALKILICLLLAHCCAGQCVEYRKGECVACDPQHRLADGKCYSSVAGCVSYDSSKRCVLCDGNVLPIQDNSCPLVQTVTSTSETLYTLAYGQSASTVTNYLDPLTCMNDPWFARCDKYLRGGEYGHFISKTSVPWQSISFQIQGTLRTFRIIYLGGGGGVMLCIIQINSATYAVVLQSLVTIAATEMVSDCLDYTVDRRCFRCRPNYHLQQNSCYANIAGCSSYFRNICVQCEGWGLLIENRCIYDCNNECDTWHTPYFSNLIV